MHNKNKIEEIIFSCSHIAKKFDQFEVLADISFTISKNEKVGLVGPNGSGKTTLLKIIAREIEKDQGAISHSREIKIKYFPQTHVDESVIGSGGEIARKLLQKIINSDADLFILDEPTNNLDLDGLKMIENFLVKSRKSFIVVSHDRKFLDNTVSKIVEIDTKTKKSSIFDGNYSDYVIERQARIGRQWKEYNDKMEKINNWKSTVEEKVSHIREIETRRKNIKNLPIHEKEKPQAAILRDKEGRAGRRAKVFKNRLGKYIEQSKDIKMPTEGLPLKITFEIQRGGTKVFNLISCQKTIGSKIIGPINLNIIYGDRWHIVGKNGAGKTTLLKMLIGDIKPDIGVIEKGSNVRIGYISQERSLNRPDEQVIKEFVKTTQIEETEARQILNRFRLSRDDVKNHISLLSPGEYSRFLIAELVATKPNCIILDEPSNHLDLEALEELENGLVDYEGTLIVVSHDRYFVDKLNLKQIYKMGGQTPDF